MQSPTNQQAANTKQTPIPKKKDSIENKSKMTKQFSIVLKKADKLGNFQKIKNINFASNLGLL